MTLRDEAAADGRRMVSKRAKDSARGFRDGATDATGLGGRAPFVTVLATVMLLAVVLVGARPAEAGYAALVMEADSGRVLYSRHADQRNYPASLTKMMTLYLTFEALEKGRLKMNQRLPVSRRAALQPPSKLKLKQGSTITVRNAILALITKSANDAATVLAEGIGKTEWQFARMMTKKARALGMKRTTFRNASGLPNRRQLSTARDMATLAVALMRDFPQYYDLFSTTSFTYKGRTYGNHNNLLGSYEGTDGIKTGYTRASGFNLVASTVRDGRRLIGVVFGGRSARTRDQHMEALLNKAYVRLAREETNRRYASPSVLPAPKPVALASAAESGRAAKTTPTGRPNLTPGAVEVAAIAPPETPRVDSPAVTPVAQGDGETEGTAIASLGPSSAAAGKGEWGIQFGAFSRIEGAQTLILKAQNTLPWRERRDAVAAVVPAHINDKPIYRARMLGFDNQTAARNACGALHRANIGCIVVRPRAGG